MIPILLISDDKTVIDRYLNINFKKNTNFFSEIIPSTKEYSINDIKNLIIETKVFHPKTRIYFLADFHLASVPAQNSFLKLLEEPPINVQFILSADNKNKLLSTIISRVKIVKLQEKNKQKDVDKFIIDAIKDLVNQTSITKVPFLSFMAKDKVSAKNLMLQIIFFFRNRLESDKNSSLIIKEIIRLETLLEKNNLNPQLTIDQLLIFIYKCYNRYYDYKKI